MEIKISKKQNPIIEYSKKALLSYFRSYRRTIGVFLVILYSILIFIGGILVHKSDIIEERIKPAIKKKRVFLKHLTRGKFSARPEHISIDIRHKDFQKLEYKRLSALELNKLIVESDDYVPADIKYRDKSIKVDLRLKGDHVDHLEGNKWSFRIKVKGDDTLFGMKFFSIQHPKTRDYIYEWIYHKALKREGIISLRYDFIEVTLNGKYLGVYAIEEFFDKRLIEDNKYREGPIIRFDEGLMWKELLQRGQAINSGSYLSSSIDAFQTSSMLKDPFKKEQFIKAMSLLEAFRRGELKTSEVFDPKKIAKFFAIIDLMGAEHTSIWTNMRFYFNPITSKLEPIGFDGNCIPIANLSLKQTKSAYMDKVPESVFESFNTALLNDDVFYRDYINELERISASGYLEGFFNEIEDELEKKLDIIYKEWPDYYFSKDIFYHNASFINATLNPVKAIHVYFSRTYDDGIGFNVGNIQLMDVEIIGLSYKDIAGFDQDKKAIIKGKKPFEAVEYQDVKFLYPETFLWEGKDIRDLKIRYRLVGTTDEREDTVFPYTYMDKNYIVEYTKNNKPNIKDFDFIMIDEEAKNIAITPGNHEISRDLIIPKGYVLYCHEGTKINLLNKAKILSYSPVQFIGIESSPISIFSEDTSGRGLVIISAGKHRSVLSNVIFKDLGVSEELTGSVTFYESNVDIRNCQFLSDFAGDDMLNIVRSDFYIVNTLFKDTFSDAFDCDFGSGKIVGSRFIKCGGDGVDFSGSVVEIDNVYIDGAGDKGISVGEISSVVVSHTEIRNSNIGIAAKDRSDVESNDIKIKSCNIGFAAYMKKSEFGPASITLDSFSVKDVNRLFLLEEGSSINADGKIILPNQKDAYGLLYGGKD
ncbi:MAG: right-handed parallel beta-helix repeat-containing protein [Candidatus Omnitrophota bacterium]